MQPREAVIVGAVRTPVGKRGGALSQWHPVDLLGHTLKHLVERTGIDPSEIDDVIAGCALQNDHQAGNIGRHAVLSAGFPESVPAVTINRECGSAQQAVTFAAYGVIAGGYDLAIACGIESMSQTPLPNALQPGAPLGPQYAPLELERYDGGLMVQGPSSELLNDGAAALLIADRAYAEAHELNGGSIAVGHPLGSTGARMLTDLLHELERTGKSIGLQTICEATGTANTTIIELIQRPGR